MVIKGLLWVYYGFIMGLLKVPWLIVEIDGLFCLNSPFWYRVCRLLLYQRDPSL